MRHMKITRSHLVVFWLSCIETDKFRGQIAIFYLCDCVAGRACVNGIPSRVPPNQAYRLTGLPGILGSAQQCPHEGGSSAQKHREKNHAFFLPKNFKKLPKGDFFFRLNIHACCWVHLSQ